MNELMPVRVANVDGEMIQTVNLRDLHEALCVRRDFSTWAKERVVKYGFVEGQDYLIEVFTKTRENSQSPDLGIGQTGGKAMVEYHASLDMAKQLAMVENNEKGREARRYFIEVERKFRSMPIPDLHNPEVLFELLTEHTSKRIQAERRADTAERIVEAVKPKVEFYDRFASADGLYGLQNAARVLNQAPNKFIGMLKQGFLFYQGGALMPKVEYRERGIFEVKATDVDGKARYQTYITPKGIQFFAEKLSVNRLPV